MFDEVVSQITKFYGNHQTLDDLEDIIRQVDRMTLGTDIQTIREQGAHLVVLLSRASLIAFPNSTYPSNALIITHIHSAAQNMNGSGNFAKKLKQCHRELCKARDHYYGDSEMLFYGAISRAMASAAKIAVQPLKKDKDLKEIETRAKKVIVDILESNNVSVANDFAKLAAVG